MQHTFHLVVSTTGRRDALAALLASVERQGERVFVTVVEQSRDRRCEPLVAPLVAAGDAEYAHEPVVRGLSRGRNRGLRVPRGQIVAFPDDDCTYPDGLLAAVRDRLLADGQPALRGLSARLTAPNGNANLLRWSTRGGRVRPSRIPRTVTSATLFLDRDVVRAVGSFDEALGSGSGTPFGAGEETDYVLRAIAAGARIEYVPELTVLHPEWRDHGPEAEVLAKVRRYNRGFGRVLRKHRRWGMASYWILRSVVAVVLAALVRDRRRLRFQRAQLAGRVEGISA